MQILTADFIYWTARQEGMAYARGGVADYTDALSLGDAHSGSTYFPPTHFSPGFKAGIGLNLGHDGWDTYLNYTWLHSNQHNSVQKSAGYSSGIIPLWEIASVGNQQSQTQFITLSNFVNMTNASASWSLHFNNFDLDLGRNYYISQYLALRPHAGLKGSWYNQHYHVSYSGFLEPDIASELSETHMDIEQHFWGVGIRTGVDTSWFFDKNWSLFGNTSLAALWGRFNVQRQDYATTLPNGVVYKTTNTRSDFHTIKPVLELQLGVRYDYWFSDDDYHLGIQAAWEEQLWFNQNQFYEVTSGFESHGDLGMQGLTLTFRFDF
ncbi:MAG: MOMP family protein [Chlamydiae bacterium]|nr:MOMP family protein [Chlamydiota bacterium]